MVNGGANIYTELKVKRMYTMPISDQVLALIGDTRIKSATSKSGCIFAVSTRMLTKKLSADRYVRYCIVILQGPNERAIDKCNKLIEEYFPCYTQRKLHRDNVPARVRFTEWTPDNTNLYFGSQRVGVTTRNLGDLELNGIYGGLKKDGLPYPAEMMDMIEVRPKDGWVMMGRETESKYTTHYSQSRTLEPVIYRNADKNKSRRPDQMQEPPCTKPLPHMNYFVKPDYMDKLIDPLLTKKKAEREAMLEMERHSQKSAVPAAMGHEG